MFRTTTKLSSGIALCLILTLLFSSVFSFPAGAAENGAAGDLPADEAAVSADDQPIVGEKDDDLAETGASDMFLNKSKMTLDIGQEYKIIAFDAASKTSIVKMKFTSSNTAVATVTAKGIVKGVKAGTAKITAQDTAANRKAVCTVTVTNQTYVKPTAEKLKISTDSVTIYKGKTYQLTATPSTGVTFSSSDTGVATVNASGVITGVSAGSATITAKLGSQSASCSVSVINNSGSGSVHISNTTASMPAGKTLLLRSNSSGVTWSSSDTSIATVSGGFVLAKKAGSVMIYASNSAGSASCLVNVSPAAPIRFAYCSPNCAMKGQKVSFIAITDKTRTAVCFKVFYDDGSTKLINATSKITDGSNYVWTGYGSFSAAGTHKVVAYSKTTGNWQTCADGNTSAFIANSTDKTTTVCTERRASDEVIDLIATFEGFLPDIYDDPWTGDPTVGYGRVIFTGQQFYNHLTKREAFAYLVQTVNNDGYATKMNEFLMDNNIKFNQQQFDALVCLVYNTGTGVVTGDTDIHYALLDCSDGTGGSGTTYYVNGSDVRLRKGAGTNYDIIRSMNYGTQLTIVQKYNASWWKVKLNDGTVGFCNTDYISSRSSSGNLDFKYINKNRLIQNICQYHHAGGECLYGLLYRRVDEMEMFFYGDYDPCYGDYKYPISFTCKNNPSFHT